MNIPEVLQQKIINDAFVMKKNDKDWLKIHNFLKSKYLKLKKTNYIFNDYFKYEAINRTCYCYFYNKTYVWLKQLNGTKVFCYCGPEESYLFHSCDYSHFNLS